MKEYGNCQNYKLTTALIDNFRQFSLQNGLCEGLRVPLISLHDTTLRFTNSTTSVLKPLLLSDNVPETGIFLVQNAMGQQGFKFWLLQHTIEHFTSYFIAMGALFPKNKLEQAINYGYTFLQHVVKIPRNNIFIRVTNIDRDLNAALSTYKNVLVNDYSYPHYRHSFGVDGLIGRNANFAVKYNEHLYDIGNIIIIEYVGSCVGIEISFDSTLLLSAMINLRHPILAYPFTDVWTNFNLSLKEVYDLIAVDALSTLIPIFLNGLVPKSRGRAGNLKLICRIFSDYCKEHGIAEVRNILETCTELEHNLQEVCSPLNKRFNLPALQECRCNILRYLS